MARALEAIEKRRQCEEGIGAGLGGDSEPRRGERGPDLGLDESDGVCWREEAFGREPDGERAGDGVHLGETELLGSEAEGPIADEPLDAPRGRGP